MLVRHRIAYAPIPNFMHSRVNPETSLESPSIGGSWFGAKVPRRYGHVDPPAAFE
jgi:hypothetical protein